MAEARKPAVKKFREHLKTVISEKNQTVLAKAGAILATGILDAGGRNVIVSFQSRAGFTKMGSVVGIMLWLQHWYWYPLMHFLSLSFTPTLLIGLNKDFDVPKGFAVRCNAPPSMFAYPKPEEKKEDKKELVATAVLSTTARAKAREARKEARKIGRHGSQDSQMTDGPALEKSISLISTVSHISVEERGGDSPNKDKVKKHEKEPLSYILPNPSRITSAQLRFVTTEGVSTKAALAASAAASQAKSGATASSGEPPIDAMEEENSPALASQSRVVTFADGEAIGDMDEDECQRYAPVGKRHGTGLTGIILLLDSDPSAPEVVTKVDRAAIGQEEEAEAPEPFVWDPASE